MEPDVSVKPVEEVKPKKKFFNGDTSFYLIMLAMITVSGLKSIRETKIRADHELDMAKLGYCNTAINNDEKPLWKPCK